VTEDEDPGRSAPLPNAQGGSVTWRPRRASTIRCRAAIAWCWASAAKSASWNDSLVHHLAEVHPPPAGYDLDELGQLMRTWSAEATLSPGARRVIRGGCEGSTSAAEDGDVLLVTSNRAIQKSSHDLVGRRSAPAPDATWQQTATAVNESGLIEAVLLHKAYRLESTA